MNINTQSSENTRQTVTWSDQSPGYEYEVPGRIDETRLISHNDETELNDFFTRPIKIHTFEWSTSVNAYEDIDPWSLYIENLRVINRISNYNVLRGNLCVKVLINGNAFYYGRLLASYLPLASLDTLTRDRALIPSDSIAASQRPHLYIDPTTNQGGELKFPFFYHKDGLRIVDDEWSGMGHMTFRELNQLRHANGATDPITVSVLAWMENVTLSVPTSNEPTALAAQGGFEEGRPINAQAQIIELEPQAGNEKKKKKPRVKVTKASQAADEYGTGPISGPATTVSRIAGMLSGAPYIGPFAKATQIAANGVGGIAKLFGYSRPTLTEPNNPFTPRYFCDMPYTGTPDNSTKLTLDNKQELTIDGTVTGLSNDDEMTIKSVVCRESFLDSTTWGTGDAQDQILMSLNVVPDLFRTETGPPIEYHMPANCFGSKLFKYWRGSIKYRFQIVSSAYHKGRLKLQWDPAGYASQEMNTQYTEIIDISDDKDFTIEIGWGTHYGWLLTRPMLGENKGYTLRAAQTSFDPEFVNGTLTVSVLNTLTSPSATAGGTVELNAFVSCGDDIEFAVPNSEHIAQLTPYGRFELATQGGFEPQSGEEEGGVVQTDADCTNEPSAPMQMQVKDTLGNKLDDSDMSLTVFHGESITSFRTVLKRYAFVGLLGMGTTDAQVYRVSHIRHFPPLPGHTTTNSWWNSNTVNYVAMHPMAYLYSAYAALRGGVRWKMHYHTPHTSHAHNTSSTLMARRNHDPNVSVGGNTQIALVYTGTTVPAETYGSVGFLPNTWDGATYTPKGNNPVLEFEAPYQTMARFTPLRWDKGVDSKIQDNIIDVGGILRPGTNGSAMLMHCAAAEDFNLHFFLGAPVFIDSQATVP